MENSAETSIEKCLLDWSVIRTFPLFCDLNFNIWVTRFDEALFQDHNLSPESSFSCYLRPPLPSDDPHRHIRRRLLLPLYNSLPALVVPSEVRADVLGDLPDHVHLYREVAGRVSAPLAQDSLSQVREREIEFSSQSSQNPLLCHWWRISIIYNPSVHIESYSFYIKQKPGFITGQEIGRRQRLNYSLNHNFVWNFAYMLMFQWSPFGSAIYGYCN